MIKYSITDVIVYVVCSNLVCMSSEALPYNLGSACVTRHNSGDPATDACVCVCVSVFESMWMQIVARYCIEVHVHLRQLISPFSQRQMRKTNDFKPTIYPYPTYNVPIHAPCTTSDRFRMQKLLRKKRLTPPVSL